VRSETVFLFLGTGFLAHFYPLYSRSLANVSLHGGAIILVMHKICVFYKKKFALVAMVIMLLSTNMYQSKVRSAFFPGEKVT